MAKGLRVGVYELDLLLSSHHASIINISHFQASTVRVWYCKNWCRHQVNLFKRLSSPRCRSTRNIYSLEMSTSPAPSPQAVVPQAGTREKKHPHARNLARRIMKRFPISLRWGGCVRMRAFIHILLKRKDFGTVSPRPQNMGFRMNL